MGVIINIIENNGSENYEREKSTATCPCIEYWKTRKI